MMEPEQSRDRSIARLRWWTHVLDEAYRVPGTRFRFGLDPIIGLVPWVGDVVTGVLSFLIVLHAFRLRIPGVIKTRMLTNVVIDVLIGTIPFLGDLFDFAWKANRRNLDLLEKFALTPARPGFGDWLFVGGAAFVFALAIALPLLLAWLLITALPGKWVPQGPSWTTF